MSNQTSILEAAKHYPALPQIRRSIQWWRLAMRLLRGCLREKGKETIRWNGYDGGWFKRSPRVLLTTTFSHGVVEASDANRVNFGRLFHPPITKKASITVVFRRAVRRQRWQHSGDVFHLDEWGRETLRISWFEGFGRDGRWNEFISMSNCWGLVQSWSFETSIIYAL